ncbi:hypothetical protein POM88_008996 [Heracleum sosnowskyi]|uniref:RNase H type-1 domain-containing protein n=1 Tax=Heracleum sosnowskyi TaxID=360622 RepID=A0AAD8J9T7_9APIA|nr:hypothetical protein POM88_008996 [Heracleum sosnowskyi]
MSYKLCLKGVFDRSQMRASVGGIMKHNERWVRGFGSMIGLADPQTAKLWAIYYGLRMAWEREMAYVVVFTEKRDAIELINDPDPAHPMAALIEMITMLKREVWSHVDIHHIHADGNVAANVLGTDCLDVEGGLEEFAEPPHAIIHHI